jgi:hypothetical protein
VFNNSAVFSHVAWLRMMLNGYDRTSERGRVQQGETTAATKLSDRQSGRTEDCQGSRLQMEGGVGPLIDEHWLC